MAPDLVVDWSESIGPLRGVYRRHRRRPPDVRALRRRVLRGRVGPPEDPPARAARRSCRRRSRPVAPEAASRRPPACPAAEIWTLDGDRMPAPSSCSSSDEAWRWIRLAFLAEARLYFVCEARPGGEDPRPLLDAALRGGVDIVQLRDPDLADEELVASAAPSATPRASTERCSSSTTVPTSSRRAAPTASTSARTTPPSPRRAAPRATAALVGLSTHSAAQVDARHRRRGPGRPDQISVGPVWETPTKPGRPADRARAPEPRERGRRGRSLVRDRRHRRGERRRGRRRGRLAHRRRPRDPRRRGPGGRRAGASSGSRGRGSGRRWPTGSKSARSARSARRAGRSGARPRPSGAPRWPSAASAGTARRARSSSRSSPTSARRS